jgi:streptogramin lyase
VVSVRIAAFAIVAAIALSACSQSAAGNGTLPARTAASARQPATKKHLQKATLRVLIPGKRRRAGKHGVHPAFVSPSTVAIESVVNPATDDITTVTDVSPGSTACGAPLADGSRICTVVVLAPPGADTFTFSTWDQIVADTIPSTANELGVAQLTHTIAIDSLNTLEVYISGIVANFETMPAYVSLPAYETPNTYAFTVYADDADGNRITATNGGAGASDPYANGGITATLNATGAVHSKLSVNGGPASSSAKVLYSADKLVLTYDGKGVPNYFAVVTFSASNVEPEPDVRVSPMFLTSTSRAFGTGPPYTLNLYSGITADLVVSEFDSPATYHVTESTGCARIVTLGNNGGTPTIPVTSGPNAGTGCSIFVSDGTSTDTVTVTNTTGSGSVTTPTFTSYPVSGKPRNIAAGPDGKLWFTDLGDGNVRTITTTGTVALVKALPADGSLIPMAAGSDGNMWFAFGTNNNSLASVITPATGALVSYPISLFSSFSSEVVGPDGNIWFTDEYGMGRITEGGLVTTFAFPQLADGVLVSDAPNLLLASGTGLAVAQISSNGTVLKQFTIPYAKSSVSGAALGSDGNLYLADSGNSSIERMTPSGTFKQFSVHDAPSDIVAGPDGALWFVGGQTLGRLAIDGTLSEFGINGGPFYSMAVGPDGAFWLADFGGKIWRATP